jgi:hypothetical protein
MMHYQNYAIDSNGSLIHIDNVTQDNRYDGYSCVGCHEELIPKIGNIRQHHFCHKKDTCSRESYLHQLGKQRMKERFETQTDFFVTFHAKNACPKRSECRWKQCTPQGDLYKVDLKKSYDTCELEITHKGFRADVMLSSKEHPDRNPVFLEIAVNHKCEQAKINSGIRIIEIDVTYEYQINCKIVEGEGVRFYNFKREVIPHEKYLLSRFVLRQDKNGIYRVICERESITCLTAHRTDSCFEVVVPTEVMQRQRQYGLGDFGMALAMQRGIEVKHCRFCYRHNNCPTPVTDKAGRIVRGKFINSSLTIPDRYAHANACRHYFPNRGFCQTVIKSYRGVLCQIWEK